MKSLNELDIKTAIASLHNGPKEFKIGMATYEAKRGTLTDVSIYVSGEQAITDSYTHYGDDGVEKFEIQLFWGEKKLSIQSIKSTLDAVKQVIKDSPEI